MKISSFAVPILAMAVLGQTLSVRRTVAHHQNGSSESARIASFETQLESLRQELKIPAYSAAIVKNQKVIWAKGFGYADVENKIPATKHTAYARSAGEAASDCANR